MGENKKTIQVNREYLSFSRSTRKKKNKEKKSRKRKQKPKTLQSAGKMRKEFMKKIKDFQKRRAENKNSVVEKKDDGKTQEEKEFDDEFNKSLGFLQDVIASNKEKERKKIEREKKEDKESLQVMLDMPSELTKKPLGELPIKVDSKIKPKSSRSENVSVYSAGSKKHRATVKVGVSSQPPYSCLKGSDRPTLHP